MVNQPIEEESHSGVAYFEDEEGHYYYQPAGDQSLVSLPTTVGDENDAGSQDSDPIMVDSESCQTETLVPSDNEQAKFRYVLVVQEETKTVINIKDEKNDDLYTFEEEKGGELEASKGEEEEKGGELEASKGEEEEKGGELEASEGEKEELPKAKVTHCKRKYNRRTHFSCNFCNYTSHWRHLLQRHMKSHSNERPHKCCVCERGFKSVATLQNHVNMHNGVKPHVCKYCKSPFTTSGELNRHVRYKHTLEKPHRCTECDYASVELSKLRRHVRSHTGERPYQCPHCTYASADMFKLKRHLRTHTGEKPYKCDHCNMCFTQSNSLKAHKLIHNVSEKAVYACELCPAKCGRKTDLRIHIQKLHTPSEPLKCKCRRCGKSFPDRYSCKIHNKSHEGEKCFKCELCPYSSTTLRSLKSHMLKHTEEKPFVCDQCDQSFRQKQLLRRHHNLYHDPDYVPNPPKEKTHACDECKRTFAREGNLIRHLASHDPHSGHRERALALKIGRQRKVQIIDGQMKADDSEDSREADEVKIGTTSTELRRGELVTVAAGGDGQQYVVVEVIQLEDGNQQQVAVVASDYMDSDEPEEEDEENEIERNERALKASTKNEADRNITLAKDVETCFGFDEEE